VVDVMDAAGGPKEEEVIECLRYSINASWRLQKYGPEGKAYGYPKHSTSDLRYLCACDVQRSDRPDLRISSRRQDSAGICNRHHAILAIIKALDQVPSCRVMASMLRERGQRIKHSQVAIDYRTLHVRKGARELSLFYT
jgi:hypothetical protein